MLENKAIQDILQKMISPQAKRLVAKELMEHRQFSERAVHRMIGLSRSVGRYQSKKQDEELKAKIIDLAEVRKRFGYRQVHALLCQDGHVVNHKRVYRLYRLADLAIKKRKQGRKKALGNRLPLKRATLK